MIKAFEREAKAKDGMWLLLTQSDFGALASRMEDMIAR
jgi:hypothetical protein